MKGKSKTEMNVGAEFLVKNRRNTQAPRMSNGNDKTIEYDSKYKI